jgi:hypothetical protein
MKNPVKILLLTLLIVSGCTDTMMNAPEEGNPENLVIAPSIILPPIGLPPPTNTTELFQQSMGRAIHGFDRYMGTYAGQYAYVNFEKYLRDEAIALAPYYGLQNMNWSYLHNLTIPNADGSRTLPSHVLGTTSYLDDDMVYFLDRYYDTMYDATSATDAYSTYQTVVNEINAYVQVGAGDPGDGKHLMTGSLNTLRLCSQ